MEQDTIRAVYPQRGGWADIQVGKTVIDIRRGEVKNPDGTKVALSRDIDGDSHSLAIRSRDNILMALDVEGNGYFDIPAGDWQEIEDDDFHRIVLITTVATQIKLHLSNAPKAFYLKSSGGGSLYHGPPEVISVTIPAGPAVLTTLLDLTGKDPIQAFSFQIISGPSGVFAGYDKDADATCPRLGVLQTVNKSSVEILNKITVIPVGVIAAPIVIRGEAWRY